MGTLYGNSEHFQTQKVLAAAQFSGAKIAVKNETPPADKFPFPITPAYADGKKALFGGDAISFHVGGSSLRGQTIDHQPEVVQWLQASESQFLPSVLNWVLPSLSLMQQDKKAVDVAKSDLAGLLSVLNDFLLTRTYLVGERISVADLSLAFNLLPAYEHVFEQDIRKKYTNVTRWFMTVVNQPQVKTVLGDVKLCEKAAQFDGKKFKELSSQAGAGAAKDTPKKEKEGKKDKKKEKPEKEKPAKDDQEDEDMDETERAMAQEPKAKDPFAEMPKTTFNFDEFKRVYSNEDTRTKALPYFFEKFDKENCSIWFCEYKYPDELTLVFMSCNLIGGMMQRLDKLRKNAFGSMCLFGTNNNSTISGLWFWRGHELAFTLSPDWQIDYDSYSWTKLDPDAPETKKLVEEYLCWEGDFGGKQFNQGKIFK